MTEPRTLGSHSHSQSESNGYFPGANSQVRGNCDTLRTAEQNESGAPKKGNAIGGQVDNVRPPPAAGSYV